MKIQSLAVICLLTFVLFLTPSSHSYGSDDSNIQVRIHVPHRKRLGNEKFHNYMVRIENRGDTNVPVLTSLTYWFDGRKEPVQSRVQTREEVTAGTTLPIESWEAIERQAQPSEISKEASLLEPGMAIELTMSRLATGLLPNGESRIAIQVGPKQFAYSNWVKIQVLPKGDISNSAVVAERKIATAPFDLYEYIVHKETTGRWLFSRSIQNKSAIRRVCHLPDGEIPLIESDWNRRQAAIIFTDHPESTCYYSNVIDVSRSKPWPEGAIASDLTGEFIPVDAPSPLEFPLELFADAEVSGPRSTGGRSDQPAQEDQTSVKTVSKATKRPSIWISVAVSCGVVLILLFVSQLKRRG